MKISPPLRAIFAVQVLGTVGISGQCQAAETGLLSDVPNSGYAVIEGIQGHYCKQRPNHSPSHNCIFDGNKCRATVEELWLKMFEEKPTEEALTQSCSQVSTRYELPGTYQVLNGFFEQIREAAPSVGLHRLEDLRVGSLPVREINARVIPTKPSETPIVFFNVRFFEFASELAKVSALPIPIKESRGVLAIDGSQEALEKNLQSDSDLVFLFINRVMYFLELEGLKPAPPPKLIQPILVRYQEGTELFAFAHEYAHIALEHRGEATPLAVTDLPVEALGISGERADWIQELEADYFGARLVREIFQRRINSKDAHIADSLLWSTPEFYFFAREIIDSVLSIVDGRDIPSKPSDQEQKIYAAFELCMQDAKCDVSTKLRETKVGLPHHPHPEIRRAVIRTVLRRPAEKSDNDVAMQALAEQMLRNAEYLGEQVKTALRDPEMRELVNRARTERVSKNAN